MNERTVGAFEAKTHFSQLLREVEQGAIIHVTLRGKSVAVLKPEDGREGLTINEALERIAVRRRDIQHRERLTQEDLTDFRDEGRR